MQRPLTALYQLPRRLTQFAIHTIVQSRCPWAAKAGGGKGGGAQAPPTNRLGAPHALCRPPTLNMN